MSSIVWDGANLIQRAAGKTEELGHVKLDPISNEYVLWVKDSRHVFGVGDGYVRGDSFAALQDAKRKAANLLPPDYSIICGWSVFVITVPQLGANSR